MTPWEQFRIDYQKQKVLIMGLGVLGGGVGVAETFAKAGAHVRVTDLKTAAMLQTSLVHLQSYSIEYTLGHHKSEDIAWADVIVRNPSVPWHHELLEYARSLQKPIVMDTQVFVEYAGLKTIGVTGTRGKTTTTMMIYEILKQHYSGAIILGGNLAHQPLLPQLEHITVNPHTLILMELSSWQLQAFHAHHVSVNYAVITNLYPDHLNYYPDLATYYHDKQAIYAYQKTEDVVCLNKNQPEFSNWAKQAPGKVVWYDDLPPALSLTVPGTHNRVNAAAAVAVTEVLGINRESSFITLASFRGVPFRMETVKVSQGITMINDTTSTTPIATMSALHACRVAPVIICGGYDKHLPLADLAQALNCKTKRIVLLAGNGTDKLKPLLHPHLVTGEYDNLPDAVSAALTQCHAGDILLFSPGFASFGMFMNEFDRGEQFNRLVETL